MTKMIQNIYFFSIFVVFGEEFNGREATNTIPENINKTGKLNIII